MRLLYGVVGEGMGDATRSRVVLEHVLSAGHDVRVVASGRAHGYLAAQLTGRPRVSVHEIHGLTLSYEDNAVRVRRSAWKNLRDAPAGLRQNVEAFRDVVGRDGFEADVVVSDFESWAHAYGITHGVPVISIDNMQVINRCRHDADVLGGELASFQLAKAAVKAKLPGAHHYLVTTFFFPPVRKPRTTLVPPILRPEILAARRERGEHVLVYQTAPNEALVGALRPLPFEFRVYGLGRTGRDGNVTACAFSPTGFVEDLRTARAVVAGGGFSLMSEAVHLRVPMLSIPVRGQFEQELNARYLEKLGYGVRADVLDATTIGRFVERSDDHEAALARYEPKDNSETFAALDALLAAAIP